MAKSATSSEAGTDSDSGTRGGDREPTTPGVQGARNAVSDSMTAVGDVLGTTVQTATEVGEDVVRGLGRVAVTAVDETASVLAAIAGGLRSILAAGFGSPANGGSRRRRESEAPAGGDTNQS